jgi:hypothetical protein
VQKIFDSELKEAQFEYMSGEREEKIAVDGGFCFRREYV